MQYSIAVSVVLSFVCGVVLSLQSAYGLRGFGGVAYIPRAMALAAFRQMAASIAFLTTCLTAVVIVHGASRKLKPVTAARSSPILIGGTIAFLYPVNVVCFLGGAFFFMNATYH